MALYSTNMTPQKRLEALINSLKPVKTEHPLIRVGPDGDGGYLLPDDLQDIEACFSPGVEQISGFEKSCADHGMDVFLADYSVDHPEFDDPKFHFTKKFISSFCSNKYMTMDSWIDGANLKSNSDLLLQMDIEGSEYEAIFSMSNDLMKRWRIMVIEFHFLDMLFNSHYFRLVCRAFFKILQTHSCVHIHPNNCCGVKNEMGLAIPPVMEFTFFRKDRFKKIEPIDTLPNPLDFDNTSNPTLILPSCWY